MNLQGKSDATSSRFSLYAGVSEAIALRVNAFWGQFR